MPLTDQAQDDLGDLQFLNVAAVNYGDNAGLLPSAGVGSTELSLASVAYVEGDTLMTADEMTYTSYARPTGARSGVDWTSVDGAISNVLLQQFGEATGGTPETAVDFGLTFNIVTADFLQWFGNLDANLVVNVGVHPQFDVGALDLTIT